MAKKALITSVGSGVGYGVLRSLRMSAERFEVVGVNSRAFSAGVFDCNVSYIVPPLAETDAYVEALIEIVDRERPQIIYPGRDAELPVLAQLYDTFDALGTFVMVGSHRAVEISNDKYLTYTVLRDNDQPFAHTAVGREEIDTLLTACSFPLIAKPRSGNASKGVQVLFDMQELERAFYGTDDLVFQEYLVPDTWGKDRAALKRQDVSVNGRLRQEEEYSVQVLLGYGGECLGVFSSRNMLQHGAPMAIETLDDAELEEKAVEVANVMGDRGLIGPCNLQARRERSRGYVFFELNARFTGISPTRAAMGFNEVVAVYKYFIEGETPAQLLSFDKHLWAYRYLAESIFSARDLEKIRRDGRWQIYS